MIGIGMGSSIPSFNLREMNQALINLLWNKDADFDDIYCAPDFPTGGVLLNESEVKESIKEGKGKSCRVRSVIEYNKKERVFTVKEIPYGVYTDTICKELQAIMYPDPNAKIKLENPGIERFNDLTGGQPNLKIYLEKHANPDKVLKYLYRHTSLEGYFGIDFIMLGEKGRFPRHFTWREVLQAHLDHEVEIYTRGYEFDLAKLLQRIHIIDGLLICIANIDEVVALIKCSKSKSLANKALQEKFLLDSAQADAVLAMRLSSLANLEVEKLEQEKLDKQSKAGKIQAILNDEALLKQEIEKGLREVAKKFGDERRTQLTNLKVDGEDEVIEEKQLTMSFTNKGAIFVEEASTLYAQNRYGVGTKFTLEDGEYIIDSLTGKNIDQVMFFTASGTYYCMNISNFNINEKQYLNNFVEVGHEETIKNAVILSKKLHKEYIVFVTKKGFIKKSKLTEYNTVRRAGAKALNLGEDDEIASVLFMNEEKIGVLSYKGYFIITATNSIRPIGRVTRGVVGMSLLDGDHVVAAKAITDDTTEILSISEAGYAKRTDIDEFRVTGRATRGVKIQNEEALCDFLPIDDGSDILVSSSAARIRIKLADFAKSRRGALGTRAIKLAKGNKVVAISKL